jgi:hypothetical protein
MVMRNAAREKARERERNLKVREGRGESVRAVVDVLHVLVHGWPGVWRSLIRRLKQKSQSRWCLG